MSRVSLGALVGLVALLAAAQAYESASLLRFIATHNTNQGFPTPLSFKVAGAQTATRLLKDSGSTEVILLSEGDDPRRFEMPAVADVLLYRTPHRSVDIQTALVIPSGPVIYWTTYDTTPNETLLATLTPEITQMRIPLREGIGSFRFYRWPGGEPVIPTAQPLPGGPRTWTNGARLIGYRLEGDLHPGGTIHWTLIWQTTQTSTEENYYHWFNHLLDQQGQMRGQKDGPSFLPTYWRPGDTVLNLFDLQISPDAPAGDYRMRVGMYAYPAIKNVSVSDTTGGSTSESVEIGPFRVEK
jgi:hypothetical protein